jgi:hypothetical protein
MTVNVLIREDYIMTFRLNEGMLPLSVRVIVIFNLKCKLFDIPDDLFLETRREHSSKNALIIAGFINAFAIYSRHLFTDWLLNHTISTAEVM